MGLKAEDALAISQKYTQDTIEGAGAVAGKPCQIQSIVDITGGHRVVFLWVDNSGTEHTSTMDVMDGQQGAQGETGATGRGIASVSVDANDHLIITYDDGTTEDAGQIEIPSDDSKVAKTDMVNRTIYVDYANGSNDNDGLTLATALKTTDVIETKYPIAVGYTLKFCSDYTGDISLQDAQIPRLIMESNDASNPVTINGMVTIGFKEYATIRNINIYSQNAANKTRGLFLRYCSKVLLYSLNVTFKNTYSNTDGWVIECQNNGNVTIQTDAVLSVDAESTKTVQSALLINGGQGNIAYDISSFSGAKYGVIVRNGGILQLAEDALAKITGNTEDIHLEDDMSLYFKGGILQAQNIPDAPSTDGTYTLKVTVSSGTPTYSWVAEI